MYLRQRFFPVTFLFYTFLGNLIFGQNYRPFQPGKAHFFFSGDSLFSLRIKSHEVIGSDTLYYFNEQIAPVDSNFTEPCGPHFGPGPVYTTGKNNAYGHTMIEAPGNMYFFLFDNGDTAKLFLDYPDSLPWDFMTNPSISAMIIGRTQESFFGQTDSVIKINLSTGDEISISKNYGVLRSKHLLNYITAIQSNADTLRKLPTHRQILDVFDFDPGDEFVWHFVTQDVHGYSEGYLKWTIISRMDLLWGDSISYVMKKERADEIFQTNYIQFDTVVFSSFPAQDYQQPPGWVLHEFNYSASWTELKAKEFYDSTFHNRASHFVFSSYENDSCNQALYGLWDVSGHDIYTEGLGRTVYGYGDPGGFYWETMICYKKQNDSLLPCPDFIPIAIDNSLASVINFEISPNPGMGSGLINWQNSSPGEKTIDVTDLNGKIIYSFALPSAPPDGQLELTGLNPGIYFLRFQDPSGLLVKKWVVF